MELDDYDNQIDEDDLIIITDKENWRPTQEYILAYARKLEFDVENDPPELLKIAEKYLTIDIPDEFCRAFYKGDLTLLYINMITKDIELYSDLEDLAKEEYLQAKQKLRLEENKVKVIPRKKIAPLGSSKALKESAKEKELLKKIEKSQKNEKSTKKNKQSNNKNINNKKSVSFKSEEDDELDLSDKNFEINNKQNKINNNNINIHENAILNLKDSDDFNKSLLNSSSEEAKKLEKPIQSKNNMRTKKEINDDDLKIKIENNIVNNIMEKSEFTPSSQRYQRSNKKRQNLRYDKKTIERMKEEKFDSISKEKILKISDDEDNNNNNKKDISNESINSIDLENQKNNYKETKIKDLKSYKNKLKNSYIKKKLSFIEDFTNNLESKTNKSLKKNKSKLSNDNLESLTLYEKELKEKMNEELEIYKQELIKNNFMNLDDSDDESDIKKNLEIKMKKLESEIRIQNEKNKNKKEIKEQKKKNELNELIQNLDKNHYLKKNNIEAQSINKLNIYKTQLLSNLNSFKKEYELKNRNNPYINSKSDTNKNYLKEQVDEYEKYLKDKYEEDLKILKEEFEQKFNKNCEKIKEDIILSNKNDSDKINEGNKELEKEYFNDLNELKEENKFQQKKMEEFIKNSLDKISISFNDIKNKSNNEINSFITDFLKKVKDFLKEMNIEGLLINDYLSELISKKELIMNKFISYVDMAEEEYKQNIILIEYFIDIIRMINEMLQKNNIKNNNKDLNEFLINEIYHKINDLLEEYKYKYENEHTNRLYPILNDALNKLMNIKYQEEVDYNMDINYPNNINNTLINDSNYNNLNSNRSMYNTELKMNNNIFNDSQLNSQRQINNNNSTLYPNLPSQRKKSPFYQNISQNPLRGNNNALIKSEEIKQNIATININNTNIPILKNEILSNLNQNSIRNYKIIIDFLSNESQKILEEQNSYYNKNDANEKLNMLKERREYSKYNQIFEQIYKQEIDKNKHYYKDIESKKSVLELIKNNCIESFNFISRYYNKSNLVNNKLSVLITHIEDYKKHFNSKKYNMNNTFNRSQNIENLLNNTFHIDRYNFAKENILNNDYTTYY